MPTERFYHLPEEKKESIREAVMEEFIRMPFEKASINQIIQNAGISRGSFYTYFEDKRDVLGYVISDMVERVRQIWDSCLIDNDGDLWESAGQILDYSMQMAKEDKMFRMLQNIVVNQDFEKVFGQMRGTRNFGEDLMKVVEKRVDTTCFRKNDPAYLKKVLFLMNLIMMESTGQYYCHPENLENIKKDFREKLEILQYGVCK